MDAKSARPDLNNKNINNFAHSFKLQYDVGNLSTSASTYQHNYVNGDTGGGVQKSSQNSLYALTASYRFENGLELIAKKLGGNLITLPTSQPTVVTQSLKMSLAVTALSVTTFLTVIIP